MGRMILLATVTTLRSVITYKPETQTKRVKLTRQKHEVNFTTSKKAVEFCLPYVCISTKFFPSEKLRACPIKGRYIIFSHQATGGSSQFL